MTKRAFHPGTKYLLYYSEKSQRIKRRQNQRTRENESRGTSTSETGNRLKRVLTNTYTTYVRINIYIEVYRYRHILHVYE